MGQGVMTTTTETLPIRLIDFEGERLIISNLLSSPDFSRAVLPQLTSDDFAGDVHQRVFWAISQAVEHGYEHGLGGVYRWMLDAGKGRDDFGLPTLSELAWTNTIELVNPAAWIASLHRARAERRAWRAAEKLRLGVEAGDLKALESAREELREVERDMCPLPASSGTIADTLAQLDLNRLLDPPRGVIESPWPRLTEPVNGGPRPGELWIVGARPSVGKTLVLLQWALTAAAAGHKVKFFSLEMPREDLLRRAIAAQGRIPHGPLVRGDLPAEWRRRVVETLERIGGYPLEIIDSCRTLRAVTANVAATPGVELVVIDYLGLVEPEGRHDNRNQEVSFISRRLKTMAMDHGVPVLAAHQLNRSSESENRRPALSDLRDSGSLEQDADVVLLLDSPGHRQRGAEGLKEAVDVLVAKQRNGQRGLIINLRMEAQFCRLEEA
jgi:replicative DNA helicase